MEADEILRELAKVPYFKGETFEMAHVRPVICRCGHPSEDTFVVTKKDGTEDTVRIVR